MSTSKILFACAPFDGYFNPLTRLAIHLMDEGHDASATHRIVMLKS